jgi:hypothetical protein
MCRDGVAEANLLPLLDQQVREVDRPTVVVDRLDVREVTDQEPPVRGHRSDPYDRTAVENDHLGNVMHGLVTRRPRGRRGSRIMASAREVPLCAPRLADPFRSLLPHSDPLGEPRQVGTGGDAQRGLDRLALPLVPVLAGVEAKCDPGPFGEEVAAAAGNLPQLGDRGLDVQRLPAHVAARGAGELCGRDPVRIGSAASDGHTRTVPLIEQTFYPGRTVGGQPLLYQLLRMSELVDRLGCRHPSLVVLHKLVKD